MRTGSMMACVGRATVPRALHERFYCVKNDQAAAPTSVCIGWYGWQTALTLCWLVVEESSLKSARWGFLKDSPTRLLNSALATAKNHKLCYPTLQHMRPHWACWVTGTCAKDSMPQYLQGTRWPALLGQQGMATASSEDQRKKQAEQFSSLQREKKKKKKRKHLSHPHAFLHPRTSPP